jgi:hypothetical protein
MLSLVASTDDQAIARKYIDLLRERRFDEIEQADLVHPLWCR